MELLSSSCVGDWLQFSAFCLHHFLPYVIGYNTIPFANTILPLYNHSNISLPSVKMMQTHLLLLNHPKIKKRWRNFQYGHFSLVKLLCVQSAAVFHDILRSISSCVSYFHLRKNTLLNADWHRQELSAFKFNATLWENLRSYTINCLYPWCFVGIHNQLFLWYELRMLLHPVIALGTSVCHRSSKTNERPYLCNYQCASMSR